ncbi:MAG: substrate-binding domain-containing protein, partial [Pseudomonadota bacterium]
TPDDVLLVGFHDSLWMTARRRPVTTVAQPVDAVAKYAWERLERRMAGDNSPVQSIILTTEILARASTYGG